MIRRQTYRTQNTSRGPIPDSPQNVDWPQPPPTPAGGPAPPKCDAYMLVTLLMVHLNGDWPKAARYLAELETLAERPKKGKRDEPNK